MNITIFLQVLLLFFTQVQQEEVRQGWGKGAVGRITALYKERNEKKKKPFRFIVRSQRRDSVVRDDRTNPILLLSASNLTSGQGVSGYGR